MGGAGMKSEHTTLPIEYGLQYGTPQSSFIPIVKYECICSPAFEQGGCLWFPRQPSCLRHGTKTRYIEPVSKLWADERKEGVAHGRSGSRRSV